MKQQLTLEEYLDIDSKHEWKAQLDIDNFAPDTAEYLNALFCLKCTRCERVVHHALWLDGVPCVPLNRGD